MAIQTPTRSGAGYVAIVFRAMFWRVTCTACPRWSWTGSDSALARAVRQAHIDFCSCEPGACEMESHA